MNKRFLGFLAIGVLFVLVAISLGVFSTRGARIRLEGSVQSVRTLGMADGSSVAVVDFRFTNPADYLFVVDHVAVLVVDREGNEHTGMVAAERDAETFFKYYPDIGPRYNQTLTSQTHITPKASMDRMVAVRFEMPESELQQRRELRIRVEDIDGPVTHIVEDRTAQP
jgi:hypothetical protein